MRAAAHGRKLGGQRLGPAQWLGLALSFAGVVVAIFLGALVSFPFPMVLHAKDIRIAVLLASVISAICGYLVLRYPMRASPARRSAE